MQLNVLSFKSNSLLNCNQLGLFRIPTNSFSGPYTEERSDCHLVALGQQPGLYMGSRIPLCQLEGQIISWSVKDLFSMHENWGCERSQFWVSLFWKSKSIIACYVLWFGKWESIGRTSSFRKDCRIICSCHIYDDNYMKKAIWGIVTRHNIWS